MQLILRTPNIHITDREREYIEKKVMHLQKLADRVADESSKIHIDVLNSDIKTTDKKLCIQGTLHVPYAYLRAEVKGVTVEEATDVFVEKMKKQIERYKAKLHRRDEKGKWIPKSTLENLSRIQEEFTDDAMPKITKRKDFTNERPMHEEEAIEQLELLDHSFYSFYNIDRDCFSVVYKRADGTFGIIEMRQPS